MLRAHELALELVSLTYGSEDLLSVRETSKEIASTIAACIYNGKRRHLDENNKTRSPKKKKARPVEKKALAPEHVQEEQEEEEEQEEQEEEQEQKIQMYSEDGLLVVEPKDATFFCTASVVVRVGALLCVAFIEEDGTSGFGPVCVTECSADGFQAKFMVDDHEYFLVPLGNEPSYSTGIYSMPFGCVESELRHLETKEMDRLMPNYRASLQVFQTRRVRRESPWTLVEGLVLHRISLFRLWRTLLGAAIRTTYLKPNMSYGNLERWDLIDLVFEHPAETLGNAAAHTGQCDACGRLRVLSRTFRQLHIGRDCASRLTKALHTRGLILRYRQRSFRHPITLRGELNQYMKLH